MKRFTLVLAALASTLLLWPACSHLRRYPAAGTLQRVDPRFDRLVPPGTRIEELARGFAWSEGPVWVPAEEGLLFSDVPKNTIYRWQEKTGLSVFLRPSGYTGSQPPGDELGTNGLTLDPAGNLVACDHGNRQMARFDRNKFTKIILADRYDGKRLNSPNDAIYRTNGDLYFTDPPYGLKGLNESPLKELPFNGVYRLASTGELTLLVRDLTFPNGIAFSPDERTLYVANSDPDRAVWMAYDVRDDGTLGSGRVFFDGTPWVKQGLPGLPDGLKVDPEGNVFASGPGGIVVFAPDGTHLGTIRTAQTASNCAFGPDGSLYITADALLLRVRLPRR